MATRAASRRSTIALLAILPLAAAAACGPAYLTVPAAGPDYLVQGEYAAADSRLAAQVIARGKGRFELMLLPDGLPGRSEEPLRQPRHAIPGERRGAEVSFRGRGTEARWDAGWLRGHGQDGTPFALQRIERHSPTLGAAPPPGAIVLLDETTRGFDGSLDEQGWLQAGATSRAAFGDIHLHLEFRTPFMPDSRGQARGNSGVYLQSRYEVQILDSFGLTGEWNECGGLYKIARPGLNMALPPLAWQTYDIDFRAARFDADGGRREPARITVRHNGVVIQDDVPLPGPTGQGDAEMPEPGPIYLQDHWNPVVFRNIWLLEQPAHAADSGGAAGSEARSRPPLPHPD